MQETLRDPDSIPGSERSSGGGHGNPLQCSAWRIPRTEAIVHRVTKNCTRLKRPSTHAPGYMRLSVAKLSEKYSKPGSLGHIPPAVYFCSALKLRMVFPDEWIEKREHCLWTSVDYIRACTHTHPRPGQRSAILLMSRTLWPKNCTHFNFGFCHYQVCGNLGSLLLHNSVQFSSVTQSCLTLCKSLLNTLEFISQLISLK